MVSIESADGEVYFTCQYSDAVTGLRELRSIGTDLAQVVLSTGISLPGNVSYNHTLAVAGDRLTVSLTADPDNQSCDVSQYDVHQIEFDRNGADQVTSFMDSAHGTDCSKEGRTALVVDPVRQVAHACWTVTTPSGDDLYFSSRPLGSPWPATPIAIAAGPATEDHCNIAVRADTGEQTIVYHDENFARKVRVDLGTAVVAVSESGSSNHPDIADRDGILYVVWENSDGIKMRTCDALATACDDLRNWSPILVVDEQLPDHEASSPQIVVDGDHDAFVFYEDEDTMAGTSSVVVASVCGPGRSPQGSAWQVVDTDPADLLLGQRGLVGNPSIVLDEVNQRVAVAYLKSDAGWSSRIGIDGLCG